MCCALVVSVLPPTEAAGVPSRSDRRPWLPALFAVSGVWGTMETRRCATPILLLLSPPVVADSLATYLELILHSAHGGEILTLGEKVRRIFMGGMRQRKLPDSDMGLSGGRRRSPWAMGGQAPPGTGPARGSESGSPNVMSHQFASKKKSICLF